MSIIETGIGPQKCLEALGGHPRRPALVLSCGFAGALDATLNAGDVIVAGEIVTEAGRCFLTQWPGRPEASARAPHQLDARARVRVLGVSRLIHDPAEKQKLGSIHRALAVDMESATIAQWCQHEGIPFGCIRTISDSVDMPLSPRLLQLLNGRSITWHRLGAAIIRSPAMVPELCRLASNTRLAARRLAEALAQHFQ